MLKQKKIAIGILVFYALFFIPAGFLAFKFLGNVKLEFNAPPGTFVHDSEANAVVTFREQIMSNPLMLLFTSIDPSKDIGKDANFRNFSIEFLTAAGFPPQDPGNVSSSDLRSARIQLNADGSPVMLNPRTQPNLSTMSAAPMSPFFRSVQAFWAIPDYLAQFRDKLLGGPNNCSSLITLSVPKDVKMMDALDQANNFYHAWRGRMPGKCLTFTMETTSIQQLGEDVQHGVITDLMKLDAVSLPLAFCCLVYCVKSLRLLILPGLTIANTVVCAFAFMYPISCGITISSFAPEMATAVMSAISVDYALFILTRFKDQIELFESQFGANEVTEWLVVRETTRLSAHNIIVSGLTIAAALGGLGLLPIPMLSTIGIAFAVGAVMAVVVAMTLMPSCLLVFYKFFSNFSECDAILTKYDAFRRWLYAKRQGISVAARPASPPSGLLNDGDLDDDNEAMMRRKMSSGLESPRQSVSKRASNLQEFQEEMREDQYNSIWFKIGQLTVTRPWTIMLVILICGSPLIYFASELKTDFVIFNEVPRDSPHGAVLKKITEEIGHGSSLPYYVTFTAETEKDLLCMESIDLINNMTKAIVRETGQPTSRILSPTVLPVDGGQFVNWLEMYALLYVSAEYRYVFNMTVSDDRKALLVALYTTFDPFDYEASEFLDKVYNVITTMPTNGKFKTGLLGASADNWQIMREVLHMFPMLIGITFAVIFVFIACVFRSVYIPARMLITVGYTVAAAFGVGVLVFQYTWSHHLWTAMKGVKSYSWTVPLFSFSLLCALTLDYDVFLLTRIVEYKRVGYSTDAAITKAVWKTGRIISAAGMIMIFILGAMMFSNTVMMNQFGCIAAFAILVDTFVVRPLFVPALMSVGAKIAFWPRKFPLPEGGEELDVDCMEEQRQVSQYTLQTLEEARSHATLTGSNTEESRSVRSYGAADAPHDSEYRAD